MSVSYYLIIFIGLNSDNKAKIINLMLEVATWRPKGAPHWPRVTQPGPSRTDANRSRCKHSLCAGPGSTELPKSKVGGTNLCAQTKDVRVLAVASAASSSSPFSLENGLAASALTGTGACWHPVSLCLSFHCLKTTTEAGCAKLPYSVNFYCCFVIPKVHLHQRA